ncbi:MAG: META domain-containing protein [Bacteroidetes bacterium]|nr:META domain-containing protein [Bacteroidota bacterium]
MVKIQMLLLWCAAIFVSQCNMSKQNATINKPVTSLPQAAIEDLNWMILRADTVDFSKLEPRKIPILIFHKDGKNFSGTSGCNNILGDYLLDKNSLTFDKISSTEMFCAGLMDAEYALLQALREAKTYTATETTCQLLGSDQKVLVLLQKIKK